MGLYDLHQNRQIADARTAAATASSKAEQYGHTIKELERKIGRLAMINQAMWDLLSQKTGVTEEELQDKVEEIVEANQGQKNLAVMCVKCHRPSTVKQPKCLYCGAELPRGNVFQQLF